MDDLKEISVWNRLKDDWTGRKFLLSNRATTIAVLVDCGDNVTVIFSGVKKRGPLSMKKSTVSEWLESDIIVRTE